MLLPRLCLVAGSHSAISHSVETVQSSQDAHVLARRPSVNAYNCPILDRVVLPGCNGGCYHACKMVKADGAGDLLTTSFTFCLDVWLRLLCLAHSLNLLFLSLCSYFYLAGLVLGKRTHATTYSYG